MEKSKKLEKSMKFIKLLPHFYNLRNVKRAFSSSGVFTNFTTPPINYLVGEEGLEPSSHKGAGFTSK
jgi:hypothetical protein